MKSAALALLTCLVAVLPVAAGDALPIEDRNFVPESGWNRDGMALQFNTFILGGTNAQEWTAEWSAAQRHQISWTVPVYSDGEHGLGDVALNYRYQLHGTAGVGVAPRVTLLLPTRSERFGGEASGLQVALPVSAAALPRVVVHANAAATWFRHGGGEWTLSQRTEVAATGKLAGVLDASWKWSSDGAQIVVVRPGLQYAIEAPAGISIVPSIAVPVSEGRMGLLLSVSFERALR